MSKQTSNRKEEVLAAEQAMKHKLRPDNVFTAMRNGEEVPDIVREHKSVAKIGNLYFEYIEKTSFKEKGGKSIQLARDLHEQGLIILDEDSGLYSWIGKPLTKQEMLDRYGRDVKLKVAGE